MQEVQLMNKKEAIAYAQITLDYMQSSKYMGELNPETFGVEMKQAFNLYPKDVALIVAQNIIETKKIMTSKKNKS